MRWNIVHISLTLQKIGADRQVYKNQVKHTRKRSRSSLIASLACFATRIVHQINRKIETAGLPVTQRCALCTTAKLAYLSKTGLNIQLSELYVHRLDSSADAGRWG